ncbi:extracellular solute-binding protein [Paenibacillus sp. FSL H7-0331]|uniref:extracellular solute-binding protein n=1 Tax=Paenibacillus sp. FSL H7-0331 TaxID=1920421 RepID=UPI00096DD60D|nr:extracellular solute-binding protein [Paenibacillus sp. FSL H7-0331]OMF04988.1 ABC transporter substrate-binding protein [Paenibacillus sp. FSL H7-0331]
MKHKNKRMYMTLALMLALATAAGCSGQTETNKVAGTDKGSAPSGQSKDADKPLSIKMFAGLYNEVPNMNDDYWSEWQKRTNSKLNVEWVPSGDLNTKLDLLLASGDLPEVVAVPDFKKATLLSAIKNGAFWDLTPFLGDLSKYPNMKNNLVKDAFKYRTIDGKIYSLPGSRSRVDPGIKIRKDWLDQLKIPVPTTLDEYADALKKIIDADIDGNGKKDTLGLIGHGVIVSDGDASFAAGFGASQPTYDAAGGLIYTSLNPQYTEMIAWFQKLYKEGILSKEFAVMKTTQAEELFQTGRAASYPRSIWWDKQWETAMEKAGQKNPQILNLALKGPKGMAVDLSIGGGGGFLISKQVPEAKVWQLLDYFEKTASESITDFAYYGTEGVHYTVVDGQKVLNEKGIKEVNTTSKGVGVLTYQKWGKVISASGSKAYNDAKIKEVANFDEIGQVDPFRFLVSDSWINVWSKYESEWKSMVTKVIVGQISMDEYKQYVDKINNLPETKQAYQEFAKNYKNYLGK